MFLVALVFVFGCFSGYIFHSKVVSAPKSTDVFTDDTNGDGKPDVFSYYKKNQLLRVEFDRNYDGSIDSWNYYSNNKISRSESDDDFNGKIDGWSKHKDENNFEWKIDTDSNGKPDATIYYIHQLRARIDWQPNESPIIIRREIFDNGNKKQEYIDSDLDGKFDLRLDFDSMGNQVRRTKLQ